jgi:hypothetical protein
MMSRLRGRNESVGIDGRGWFLRLGLVLVLVVEMEILFVVGMMRGYCFGEVEA